jgi:hypothetical protein
MSRPHAGRSFRDEVVAPERYAWVVDLEPCLFEELAYCSLTVVLPRFEVPARGQPASGIAFDIMPSEHEENMIVLVDQ